MKILLLKKRNSKLIKKIHNSFYSEVDQLLLFAKNKEEEDNSKDDIIIKSNRLKKYGFTSTKEAKLANQKINENFKVLNDNKKKDNLIEAINYFSRKYPLYKFITQESVMKLCEKYCLIYGDVKYYIGDVPEKNLQQIEKFKIDKEDECYVISEKFLYSPNKLENNISYSEYELGKLEKQRILEKPIILLMNEIKHYLSPLEIVASSKDFDLNNMEIKNFKISKKEIPDPVVLKPVFYNGDKYYLIITAWGDEASDESVVNTNFN